MTESVQVASGSLPGFEDGFSANPKKNRKPLKKSGFLDCDALPPRVGGGAGDRRFAQSDERIAKSVLRNVASGFSRKENRVTQNTACRGRKKARLLRDARGRVPRVACVRRIAERIANALRE